MNDYEDVTDQKKGFSKE